MKKFLLVVASIWVASISLHVSFAVAETKEFILTVTDDKIVLNGNDVMIWAYNGSFPGPEIRVQEGDTVKVTLRNQSSAKHGLFFHGLHVDSRTNLQEQTIFVDPGYEYTYGAFVAEPAGTHLYHCSWNMAEHLSRGMFGSLIVEGKNEGPFDRELVYILSDWSRSMITGESSHEPGHPRTILEHDIATLNDQVIGQGDPSRIKVKEKDRIRIRFANIGYLPHRIRFPDGFLVTHEDGYPISEPKHEEMLTLFPGKRYDLLVTANRSGKWPFYHRIERPRPSGFKKETGEPRHSSMNIQGESEHPREGSNKEEIAIILDVTGDGLLPLKEGSPETK
ncbi:MAG: multicopper oxidase domain-containing protein [Nitrospirae bacterium]|nr:multicopper oxidase domain-containing protein [Nitrospirota bacterium]